MQAALSCVLLVGAVQEASAADRTQAFQTEQREAARALADEAANDCAPGSAGERHLARFRTFRTVAVNCRSNNFRATCSEGTTVPDVNCAVTPGCPCTPCAAGEG